MCVCKVTATDGENGRNGEGEESEKKSQWDTEKQRHLTHLTDGRSSAEGAGH